MDTNTHLRYDHGRACGVSPRRRTPHVGQQRRGGRRTHQHFVTWVGAWSTHGSGRGRRRRRWGRRSLRGCRSRGADGPTSTAVRLCIQVGAGIGGHRDRNIPQATQGHLPQAPLHLVVPTAVPVHLLLTLPIPCSQQRVTLPTVAAAASVQALCPVRGPSRARGCRPRCRPRCRAAVGPGPHQHLGQDRAPKGGVGPGGAPGSSQGAPGQP